MVPSTIVVALLIVLSSVVNSKPDKRTGILQVQEYWFRKVDVQVDIEVLDADDEFTENQWLCTITTKDISSKKANQEILWNNPDNKLTVSVSDDEFENDCAKIQTELESNKTKVNNNEDNSVEATTFSKNYFNATFTPINRQNPITGVLITLVSMRSLKKMSIHWNGASLSAFFSDKSFYGDTFYITGNAKTEIETKFLGYDTFSRQWVPRGVASTYNIYVTGASPMKVSRYTVYSAGFAILTLKSKHG